MTPKVRSLDGVVCVLLCVELNPCRLHVVLLSRATCRICKRDVIALMKVVIGIKAPKHLSTQSSPAKPLRAWRRRYDVKKRPIHIMQHTASKYEYIPLPPCTHGFRSTTISAVIIIIIINEYSRNMGVRLARERNRIVVGQGTQDGTGQQLRSGKMAGAVLGYPYRARVGSAERTRQSDGGGSSY
jgi:hypothetical protein